MSDRIVIEIAAEFVDNASAQVDALSAKVDNLNGKRIVVGSGSVGNLNLTASTVDNTTRAIDSMNRGYERTQKLIASTGRAVKVTSPRLQSMFDTANRINIARRYQLALPSAPSLKVPLLPEALQETIAATEQSSQIRRVLDNAFANNQIYGYENRSAVTSDNYIPATSYIYDSNMGYNPYATMATYGQMTQRQIKALYGLNDLPGENEMRRMRKGIENASMSSENFSKGINRVTKAAGVAEDVVEANAVVMNTLGIGTEEFVVRESLHRRLMNNFKSNFSGLNFGAGASAVATATGNKAVARVAGMLQNFFPGLDMKTMPGMMKTFGSAIGLFTLAKNITGSFSDVVDAYNSNTNAIDKQNSIYKSSAGAAGTTIGGVLGGVIGSLLPGGTLIGAGIGSAVGNFAGSAIGNIMSPYDKTWDEYVSDAVKKYWGNSTFTSGEANQYSRYLMGNGAISENNGFYESHNNLTNYRNDLQSAADNLKIIGSEAEILGNLKIPIGKESLNTFTGAVQSYGKTAKEYLSSQMFNELAAVDDFMGPGSEYVDKISNKYGGALKDLVKIQSKLDKYLKKAGSSADPIKVTAYKDQMQGIVNQYTQTSMPSDIDAMNFLAGNGAVSKDSFNNVISQMGTSFSEQVKAWAMTRSSVIAQGGSEADATRRFYEKYTPYLESQAQNVFGFARNWMASDINYDTNTTNSFWDNNTQRYVRENNVGNRNYVAKELLGDLSRLRGFLGIDKSQNATGISPVSQGAYSELYKSMESTGFISALEKNVEAGRATSQGLTDLMQAYQVGAFSGDESAMNKYAGFKMATDTANSRWWDALINENQSSLPPEMISAYNWAKGNNVNLQDTANSSGNQQTDNAPQVEISADKTVEATKSSAEKMGVGADNAAEALKNGIDKWPQTAKESADRVVRDTDSLARDVLGAINTSFANVSDSELGKMPIGQSVMQSIVSSMQNIDSSVMGTLNIGQGIMDTINASLSNIDASAMGTLPIGQTVMNAIGNSITNISPDLSADLNIGESLMASVNSSLASVDFSSLDFNIGASLMSKLNESLSPENIGGAIDGSAIGASVMSSINAGLSSAELTVTPTVKVVPNYVMENGGAGLLEQLSQMSLSMQATTSATVKYGLDASAIDGYTPSDKTGVVKYSVDSSAVDGYSPPNKSATVTYYITTVGTIPDPGSIHHAMGTPFAMDEFATINDQITANPTEMVVHNNRGYLFAGRNVQIPLSTGDRVFTASQTQRMLSGNFDEGYNNQIVSGRYDDSIFGEDNSGNTVASGSIMVNLGGIAFHIDASGANGDVLTAIEENYETIAREVTNIIKQNLEDNFRNTPKRITM